MISFQYLQTWFFLAWQYSLKVLQVGCGFQALGGFGLYKSSLIVGEGGGGVARRFRVVGVGAISTPRGDCLTSWKADSTLPSSAASQGDLINFSLGWENFS